MSVISKTTFTVLHRTDEPFVPEQDAGEDDPFANPLGEALARSYDGHAVGRIVSTETVTLAADQVPAELVTLGNDGGFFDLDLDEG